MANNFAKIISFIIISLTIISNKAYAQISEGGTPPSFTFSNMLKHGKNPVIIPIDADIAKLKYEDLTANANGMPLRAAKIIETDLTIDNSGEWITLPNNQRIWQLTVKSPNAIATLLYYNEFYIPTGAKLFIYNENKDHILGAYTNKTNPVGKEFATEFVAGDVFTIEYVAPEKEFNNNDMPRIAISGVAYGYNNTIYANNNNGDTSSRTFDKSASCLVNINCVEGDDWKKQKRGIARILTPIGSFTYFCTGTMINNTANDFTPYFLSAHHCFHNGNGIYAGESGLNRMIFYFNYEHPGCHNLSIEPKSKTIVGAQMMVYINVNGGSDGALLRLNNNIPDNYNVYYNGWDRTNSPASNGVCIHHPKGDVKKISAYTTTIFTSTWVSMESRGANNAHWRVRFSNTKNGQGITEAGSSGSPLFNQNGLVIGTLTGGSTHCDNPNNIDYYGKLWYHWNQYSDSKNRMNKYLDPLNTGQLSIAGIFSQSLVAPPTSLTAQKAGTGKNQVQLEWKAPQSDEDEIYVPAEMTKYIIYRNDEKIAETNSTLYLDINAEGVSNEICYHVTALYNNGSESEHTNTACVSMSILVTGVKISPDTINLKIAETLALTAKIKPGDATNQNIIWESDSPSVAEVDATGKVTAVRFGMANIIVTTEDGNFTSNCFVRVYNTPKNQIKPSEAFSPNGDGLNDYFIIERIEEFQDNELTVFDRSGAVHYKTKSYANNWDGIANSGLFKGEKLPAGTYYYQLKVEGISNTISGFIVIKY